MDPDAMALRDLVLYSIRSRGSSGSELARCAQRQQRMAGQLWRIANGLTGNRAAAPHWRP